MTTGKCEWCLRQEEDIRKIRIVASPAGFKDSSQPHIVKNVSGKCREYMRGHFKYVGRSK